MTAYELLNRTAPFVLGVAIAACAAPANDPVSSAREVARLARGGKCEETWPHYTKKSQRVLEQRTKKEYGAVYTNVPPEKQFKPYDWECGRFSGYLPRSMRELQRSGDTALIAVIWRTGTRFPIIPFLSSPLKDSPSQMQMALEDGAWKVVVQSPPETPRHLVDHGKWKLDWPRQRRSDYGGYSASGLMDADTEAAEAVLLDYQSWPKWMPYLVEARALGPIDSVRHQKVYGRFQLPGDTTGVDVILDVRLALLTRDQDFKGFGASWTIAKNDTAARVDHVTRLSTFSANISWRVLRLASGPVGLQVRYRWSALPGEWPPALAEKVFSPEYTAQLLGGLEREARARAGK